MAAVVLAMALGGCTKKVVQAPSGSPGAGADHVIEHRIVAGETLALIADNYYGDPLRAPQIARDNDVADATLITPGSVLRLRFSDAEWDEARRRADALTAYNRGVDLMGQERLAEAEQQFRLALGTAPGLAAARYNLALVLVQRGRTEEALPLLDRLITDRPADRDFRFARGHALFTATRFAEAADEFGRVLELDPAHRRAAFGRARALTEDGRRDAAIAAWNRYLELDADSSWAVRARSQLQALQDGD
jgi:tetratricopeptide (TPR) repeat protein